jgi:hypothetical protein
MSKGELAAYKSKNIANFGALRDLLTKENAYVDNLNAINKASVDKQNVVIVPSATKEDIASVYTDILGRRPKRSEVDNYINQKINKDDLIKALKNSPEYESHFYQTEYDQYGHKIEYDASGKQIQKDRNGNVIITGGNTSNAVVTNGNTSNAGITTILPEGGGTGLVPPITYYTPGTMTREEMDAYGKKYAQQSTPTSPYNPITGPQFSLEGAMPYQDVDKQLGLTGLYKQISEKTPELKRGLTFDPMDVKYKDAAASINSQANRFASGGMSSYNLGGYSDGGRLLKGPGDGVSDSIPATIGDRQPARLADGEFVVPARIVSELGNGSTDAGARKLYAMMERIQRARSKTVGKNRVAVKSGADNMLPA